MQLPLAFGLPKTEKDKTHFNSGHNPQYLNAIKFVRGLTGIDLKSAKAFVDAIRAETTPKHDNFNAADLPR